ncbi:MAG: SemiSWEET transporter [Candidatus Kapaibacterium sp.]|jgi:MtN3 and saliva related transmembrane protein|nr:SemiSWEET transporter [Candidatus Kapabacteria bacterium]
MGLISLYGYIAAICTTISFIPQIIKIFKDKEAKDISIGMYLIFGFGVLMWLVYGILLNAYPIVIANSFTLFFVLIILYLKYKYG